MSIKYIIILIVIAFVLIFVMQNTQVVEVQFLAWKISMSRALMLLGTLFIGLISGWLLKRPRPGKQ